MTMAALRFAKRTIRKPADVAPTPQERVYQVDEQQTGGEGGGAGGGSSPRYYTDANGKPLRAGKRAFVDTRPGSASAYDVHKNAGVPPPPPSRVQKQRSKEEAVTRSLEAFQARIQAEKEDKKRSDDDMNRFMLDHFRVQQALATARIKEIEQKQERKKAERTREERDWFRRTYLETKEMLPEMEFVAAQHYIREMGMQHMFPAYFPGTNDDMVSTHPFTPHPTLVLTRTPSHT